MFESYVAAMDVALIQWPSDEALRLELAEMQHPRLLLVEPDVEPPVVSDVLEDWIRLPVSRADRNARVRTLESRIGAETTPMPVLSRDGLIEYGGARTRLSEIQAILAAALIERFGAVVSRESLVSAAWPDTDASSNNLDVSIGRLRRQLYPLGLRVRTVRSRGYLLCDAETAR